MRAPTWHRTRVDTTHVRWVGKEVSVFVDTSVEHGTR